MTPRLKSNLIKYGVTIAICGAATAGLLFYFDVGSLNLVNRYRVICDSFTIPGIMCLLSGLMMFVSNEGAFDGLGYALSVAAKAFVPGARKKTETYHDYLERKKELRENKVTGYGFLFVVGAVFLGIAMVFYYLFYTVYTG